MVKRNGGSLLRQSTSTSFSDTTELSVFFNCFRDCKLERHRAPFLLSVMFLINFLHGGTVKSLGVYLEHIKLDLQSSGTVLGFVFGVPTALTYIMEPLGIYVSRHFGFRLCMMCCAIVLTIGWGVASSFSTTVIYLLLTFTIVGVGAGLVVVPSNVAIIPHFGNSLAFANAVGNSGMVFGFMLLPPLAEFFNSRYGWRGSMLIFAGFVFHMCAIAALLRPKVFDSSESPTKSSVKGQKGDLNFNIQDFLSEEPDSNEKTELLPNDNRHRYGSLLLKIHVAIFTLLGLSVLTWAVFLVPHAVDSGMPMRKAVFLSSIGGIGGLIGYIHLGPIVDNQWMTSSQVYLYMTVMNIASIVFDYLFATSHLVKFLTAFIGGFTLLGRGALRVPMAAEMRESLDTILSYSFFFYGIACLLGTTVAGFIHDLSGSYQQSILSIAAVEFISSLLVVSSMVLSVQES